MRVAVDIDNVVLDWQNCWADLYELWFDKEIPAESRSTWNACLDETHFVSMSEFYNWFTAAYGWNSMRPVRGAFGGLYTLTGPGFQGDRFHFCTSRPPSGEQAARALAEHRFLTRVDFFNNQSKHLSKADVWIDDSPEVLANLVAEGKCCIRFEQPWNADSTDWTHTASNWAEVIDLLSDLRKDF